VRVSTLDLFQRAWVLVAADERWSAAAGRAAERLGIEVEPLQLGSDVRSSSPDSLRGAFGLRRGGATLVRPDGYIAWRSLDMPADPDGALVDALGRASASARAAHA